MKVLFDQGTPTPLRKHLSGHSIETVYERGWSILQNGELLDTAEQNGFDLLITTDQNLKFQQNFANRSLAVLVLLSTSWPKIQQHVDDIRDAIDQMVPGDDREISIGP